MFTSQSFKIEQTGGGCTALVRDLPSGCTLVLSNGNLGHDLTEGNGVDRSASLYSPGHWETGQDAFLEAFAADEPAILAAATHLADIDAQHGWGVCDHECCPTCAGPEDIVLPATECRS